VAERGLCRLNANHPAYALEGKRGTHPHTHKKKELGKMAMKMRDVLTALEAELEIKESDDMELPLTRKAFDYIMVTRAGLADKGTHVKYWEVLRTARILRTENQHTGALLANQFEKVYGQIVGVEQ
jgi:MarR-like DNA-binding transcriptional regulator SgrR of sgrS sRNA